MKAILEYTLPEDKEDFERATKALDMELALWDIANEVFRPARKHGYPDPELSRLAENNEELIGLLEQKFYAILEERGIKL
jgi:hypothetical protein